MENKRYLTCLVAGILLSVACAFGQTITCKDTSVKRTKIVMVATNVTYDSVYQKCDTSKAVNYASHYLNNINQWFFSNQGQDAMIAWLKSNGEGKAEPYGIDGKIGSTSNWKWIQRWNKHCAINGILSFYVWSDGNNVTGSFDKYQKAQTDPDCKFKGLKNEGEPYNNTISYTAWWKFSRQVHDYAKKNGLPSEVYIGWHSQQSYDSIVVLYDAISIHSYISSLRMTQSNSLYGYTNTRLGMIASSMERMYPTQPTKQMINDLLTSSELDFGGGYYKANNGDFRLPLTTYMTGFNSGASAAIKKRIKIRSNVTFVSAESAKYKPIIGMPASAMRMIPEKRTRKMVGVDSNGNPKVNEIPVTVE
jgi:hypothetical protein